MVRSDAPDRAHVHGAEHAPEHSGNAALPHAPVLLAVQGLHVRIGPVTPVTDVSFSIRPGEFFGVVGESGSGKSMTARSIIGLLPAGAVRDGSITLDGEDMVNATARRIRQIRSGTVGFVFQDPVAALDPIYTVGKQLVEVQNARLRQPRARSRARALELLDEVGIHDPTRVFDSYPHQLSGGMAQRVVIALALISDPKLIIADEPTTALDVTIQRQVLDLLRTVARERGAAVMLITHDLAVVAETCERVAVFYGGIVVEEASAQQLFDHPRHHYTRALLQSLPRLGHPHPFHAIPGSPIQVRGRLASCPFAARCVRAEADCRAGVPPETTHDGHRFRCLHPAGDDE